ncbi:hypothetical protein J2T17_005770 [Paenibacillus mucilaginosus]
MSQQDNNSASEKIMDSHPIDPAFAPQENEQERKFRVNQPDPEQKGRS